MLDDETPAPDGAAPPPRGDPPRRRSRRWLVLAGAALLLLAAFLAGALPRTRARATVKMETEELAVPYVSVVRPQHVDPSQQIALPGDVAAWTSASIFARTDGYLERWYVDIGSRVKKGQLLATIASPEVDQELQQARALVAVSEANLKLSGITATRFTGLLKTKSVSQQETDNAVGTNAANGATVAANRANVQRLEALQSFQRVRAPFDGVISVRNIDVGDLINAGSSTALRTELFHIVRADKLRVYVSVPEAYARLITPDLTAEITMPTLPGRTFTGTLVRTANAIDPTTRTLQIQIEIDNPTGTLFAGAYAEVRLKVATAREAFILPVDTLIFRKEGLQVACVRDDRVEIKKVEPGHDFGDRIEIVHGLTGDEAVIMSPLDSISTGQQVRIAPSPSPSPPPNRASL